MLKVTEKARKELKQLLEMARQEPDQTLRLVSTEEGHFKLALDVEREGDQVVQHEDSTVLVLAQDVSLQLDEALLDCEDTPGGPSLTLSK